MLRKIVLHTNEPTNINVGKNKNVFVERLVLCGEGKLNSCMMTFFRKDRDALGERDLLFMKPLHEKSETLYPHLRKFRVTDFDHCSIQVFTGEVSGDDKITLYLATEHEP